MAYSSWSVSFNEQPSAAKWNILGTNDASFNDGTGIANAAILPNHLVASTGTSWAWQSWTPTWTSISGSNPAIGNGTWACKYIQIGKTVFYRLKFTAGSTTTFGSADWRFTLPVTPGYTSTNIDPHGLWFANDTSSGTNYMGQWGIVSGVYLAGGFTYGTAPSINAAIGPTVPFAWATSDILQVNGFYEAA